MNLLDLARSALPAGDAARARTATPAEAAELRTLIERVLAACPEEIEETVQIALADVDDALVCFRALVADLPVYASPLPELPTCNDCRNLTTTRDRDGCRRCLAAGRGELADVHRRYCPDTTTTRRCLAFLPASSYSDQRSGAQRWPWLVDASICANPPGANAGAGSRPT